MPYETQQPPQILPPGILSGERVDADAEVIGDWLAGLRAAGVRKAGPALLLALKALRRADLSPSRRLSVLRIIKEPLLKTCGGLPKPWPSAAATDRAVVPGITLEQRLYRQMFLALQQTLHQLDRCYTVIEGDQRPKRDRIVRNLFRFFEREIRYSALWKTPLSPGSWSDLHELYVYLMVCREPPVRGRGPEPGELTPVDPDIEYKQQLLFGLAAAAPGPVARSAAVTGGLPKWAARTGLADPRRLPAGDGALFVVELSEDTPPRRYTAPLDASFRGWLMSPPAAFVRALESAAGTGEQGVAAETSGAPPNEEQIA